MCRCLKVTDRGFSSVAKWCKGLQELRVYACSALTDHTLVKLGANVSSLKVLDCCGANALTGELASSGRHGIGQGGGNPDAGFETFTKTALQASCA